MDFTDGEARKIISEQREQLMQLREQLKQQTDGTMVRQVQTDLRIRLAAEKTERERKVQKLQQFLDSYVPCTQGKTIGLKIRDDLRNRLIAEQMKRGAKAYRQVVMTCIELGLQMLEDSPHAEDSMEAVPQLLGPVDSGNGAYPTAAAG